MIRQAIPQLPSLDLARSRDFYERKLDFVLHRQYEDLIILKRDDIEIHLWHCTDPAIPQSSSLYFRVTRDIEDLYEHCERKGIIRLHLEDRPWGMKEFYVGDPDGNLLKFGQPSFGVQ